MHRRILAIDQETFHAPANLVDFKITDGKIDFDAGARIQADGLSTNIDFTNVLFTSKTGAFNGHRGLHLYGQEHVNIEGCIFEYGSYGIYAFQSIGGWPLTIKSSCFFNNDKGFWVNDRGFDLIQCFFWDNNYGIEANVMSLPSYTLDGTIGSPGGGNTVGIDFRGHSTASLFIEDPFIRGNQEGVTIHGVDLKAQCGIVAYNQTGFDMQTASNLYMDNGAAVTAVANNTTIKPTQAFNLFLDDGLNDLTPVEQNAQRCINGTVLTGGQILANQNKWNDAGTFGTSDYSLNIPVVDNNPLASITSCGQAIIICPDSPCDEEMVAVEDDNFNLFKEGEFTGFVLKENVVNRITEINSTEHPDYPEIIYSFYESLLNYGEPYLTEEERSELYMQYRVMMNYLGWAFRLEQFSADQNYPNLSDEMNKVIEVQDIIIQYHIDAGNRIQAIATWMDKAQTYRLASRRDLARIALADLALFTISEEELNQVNEFDCRIAIEEDLLGNELSIIDADLPALIEACTTSSLRKKSSAQKEDFNKKSIISV